MVSFAALSPFKTYEPIIANKVEEVFTPSYQEELSGLPGQRVNINLEKRLLQIDSAILLSGFKQRPGDQVWIGEHVGKFLFSASLTYRYTRNQHLKQLMDDMASKYMSYQLPNGYMGTYLPKDYWTEWDVWAHKYCIIGLLNYYQVTGNKKALATAQKAADLICRTFGNGPEQLDLMTSGHHVGMAAGSILEPMVDLYRYTGDKKYLDFAKYILGAFEQQNGPKIISSLEKYGRVDKVGNAKAYEMLSCLVGMLKYYKLTGDKKYLTPLQTAWQDIVSNRLYVTGTASSGEHFHDNFDLKAENDDHMGEGCVTTTWIQFNDQLLRITGEAKYASQIERSFYNHLLAAENPQTGCVSYYTALRGVKPYKCDQGYSCCLSSVPRGISMIPYLFWGKISGDFSVLLYESGEVKDKIVTKDKTSISLAIQASSGFPAKGKVVYTISPDIDGKIFTLNFRVPAWAAAFNVQAGGKSYTANTNDFVRVEKAWNKGEKVSVTFDILVKIVSGNPSYKGFVAIERGPQVLAADSLFGDFKNLSVNQSSASQLKRTYNALPAGWEGTQAYSVTGEDAVGNKKEITLVPFADASQKGSYVSVWLKKSEEN
jgi:DUF1680 family protein